MATKDKRLWRQKVTVMPNKEVAGTFTASCRIMVTGIEMACPLCGTLVQSGERHSCKVTRRAK
jgi:hypothetical protein